MKPRYKPDWMSDCKFIDELKEDEIAFVIDQCFILSPDNQWHISRNELCSPYRRGTHQTMIARKGDIFHVRGGVVGMAQGFSETDIAEMLTNSFPVEYTEYSLEEKVAILWAVYLGKRN